MLKSERNLEAQGCLILKDALFLKEGRRMGRAERLPQTWLWELVQIAERRGIPRRGKMEDGLVIHLKMNLEKQLLVVTIFLVLGRAYFNKLELAFLKYGHLKYLR
jgi:hypothetical protein